ncbi:MAG: MFS transporter [Rhodobacteraceae bacterium]|nr:MAG: MFS transporter [Paracoccaceae bacterium]
MRPFPVSTAAGDKRSYYRLFSGYVLAMVSTGVAVVALSVLAFRIAGEDAGAVIGTALSIKMLAYVLGAPLAAAYLSAVPRRPLMVGLDLLRAGAIFALPFVTHVWQIYALVFLFTLCSAAFTPAYQASVPHLLPDPDAYATSLARSRVASELEGAVSPLIAAALFLALSLRGVFLAAMSGFLLSALLIASARLPTPTPRTGALATVFDGFRRLFSNRALRGLPPLALGVGAASAMVMVNTVVLVQGDYTLPEEATALALGVFGLGSVAGALALPPLLRRAPERALMLAGGATMAGALALGTFAQLYATLLALWAAIGLGAALASAPAASLIRRAVEPEAHQTVYAAWFSWSAASMGIGYAAAGWLGATISLEATFAALAVFAAAAAGLAALLWPALAPRPTTP